MKEKYYLAYGSNLSMEQMAQRCPDAVCVGKGILTDYQLLFKGRPTGSYLTVEPLEGSSVPVLVWIITEKDEASLDCYEGFPNFYYKKQIAIEMESLWDARLTKKVYAMMYVMHEERMCGEPTARYYSVCLRGYRRFGFDEKYLEKALVDSVGKDTAEQVRRKVEHYA